MNARGAYGANLASALSAKVAPSFLTRTSLKKSSIAVTQIRCDVADNILTAPVENEDAILVMLQLRDWPKRILWSDGRPVEAQPLAAGAVSIFDLRTRWVGHRVCPIHQLNFYLPRHSLDEIADTEGLTHVQHFNNDPLIGASDHVIWNLGKSLLQAFDRPNEANQLFVDHVTAATAAYVLRKYGIVPSVPRLIGAKLSFGQEMKVKEMIAANLDGALSTASLAAECSLSISEFNVAFERSVGVRPDIWLAERRIERAMLLLRWTGGSLNEIAAQSGFYDGKHLSRVFWKIVGVSPEEWRHLLRH